MVLGDILRLHLFGMGLAHKKGYQVVAFPLILQWHPRLDHLGKGVWLNHHWRRETVQPSVPWGSVMEGGTGNPAMAT